MAISILPYSDANRSEILSLSLRAWAPVFEQLEPAVQPFVYQSFYPNGWQARHRFAAPPHKVGKRRARTFCRCPA
jgi:hypothetical protein